MAHHIAPLSNLSDVAFEMLQLLPNMRFVVVGEYAAARHYQEQQGSDCVVMDEPFARAFIADIRANRNELTTRDYSDTRWWARGTAQ